MKVLTIKNPWADWIIYGLNGQFKATENRTWETLCRGRIMIHVSKTLDQLNIFPPQATSEDLERWEKQKGHIIGTVELYAIDREMKTQWDEPGLFHWRFKNPLPLKRAIPVRGSLGLWNYIVKTGLGVSLDGFDEFAHAVRYKKEYGWKSIKGASGEWYELCQGCSTPEIIREYRKK